MIAFLNGTVFSRTLSPSPACVVLDVGGVGYEVFVPLSTFDALPPEGAACRLLIHDYIREDARTLFGFLTSAEKGLFLQLQSVSGVGPKLALSALSAMTVRALRDALIREDARLLAELVLVLRGEVAAGAVLVAGGVDFGMAREVVFQALGHVFALRHYADAARRVLEDFVEQQGVMRAAEDDGVYLRVAQHDGVEAFLHEIVGSGGVVLVVLDEGHPQRAGHARDGDVGPELLYFERVALALDGALGGEHAYVARQRQAAYALGRGAYHAEHAARGVEPRQVVLLYGAQGLGRGCVAGQYDEAAAQREEFGDGFARELVNHVERARAVGGAGVVAEVDVVVLGQQAAHLVEYGEAAVAGVEHADGTLF